MGDETTSIDAELHRKLGVQLFNRTWELLDDSNRSPAQDREMLGAALGSHYHWSLVGDEKNFAIGDWQVARVLVEIGDPQLAQQFADLALRRAVDGNLGPFLVGYGHEILARVAAAKGDVEARDNHLARAADILSMIEDDEERSLLAGDLETLRD